MCCRKKPAHKKPAGAVSMFGGVDLFGRSEQSSQEPVKTAEAPPTQPKAPPTQPKAASRPEKLSQSGGGGLFDGGEEGDDDDIFSFQPATKKNKWALYRINTQNEHVMHATRTNFRLVQTQQKNMKITEFSCLGLLCLDIAIALYHLGQTEVALCFRGVAYSWKKGLVIRLCNVSILIQS